MYLVGATLLLLVGLAVSYPTGAPIETCKIFTANHTGHNPQNSEPKYDILLNPSAVAPGETVFVTIQGVGGEKFKGFFIQGQDETNKPVGKFKSQADAQTRDCSGPGSATAATHVDAEDKTKVTLQWQAPASFTGKVVFRAVIVKTYEIFWDNLLSNPLTVG